MTGGSGDRTCTCACPTCASGATCPPCACACGAGNVGVSNTAVSPPPTTVGPAEIPADPCARHGDAGACAADSASACKWFELGIVCVTAPCPTGTCVQRKPVAGEWRVRVRVRGVCAGSELPAVRLRLLRSAGGPVPRSRPFLIALRKRARLRARALVWYWDKLAAGDRSAPGVARHPRRRCRRRPRGRHDRTRARRSESAGSHGHAHGASRADARRAADRDLGGTRPTSAPGLTR